MSDTADLGLFPLDLVLLPGERLPMHLFEARYRQLYADTVVEGDPFVIVRETQEGRETTGCAARFEELLRRHPDGRLDVIVRGSHAVEIVEHTGGREYLSAMVRTLVDEDDAADDAARAALLERYREFSGGEADLSDRGAVPLSYALGGDLPLDLASKQALLAERSEARRVTMLSQAIERAVERNARVAENAKRASTNGHVPHP